MKRFAALLVVLIGLTVGASAQTCATFPCVVASVSLANQTQRIPPTPIFTPSTTGVFRVSVYISTGAGNKNEDRIVFLTWTDDFGLKFAQTEARENSYDNFSLVVKAVGGQPLSYQTGRSSGDFDPFIYNLSMVVEQLQ